MSRPSRSPTLAEILNPSANRFALVRLAMASAVLVSHAYFFVSGTTEAEPLYAITGHTLGEHAVQVFFILSGLLVTASCLKRGSVFDFACARALRIVPGLAVCVLLTAFVLGPLVTTLPASAYFADPQLARYVTATLLLITGSAPLPGVFETAPARGLVNMSLWTLKYEVACYAGLGLLAASGALTGRARHVATPALALLVATIYLDPVQTADTFTAFDNMRYFALYFATGVLACLIRDRLVISALPAILLGVLYVSAIGTRFGEPACALFLGYATLYAGTIDFGWLGRAAQKTDLSYGVYIYAAPIQQAVLQFWPGIHPLELSAVALVLSFYAAFVSWHVIEKPAMALRGRLWPIGRPYKA